MTKALLLGVSTFGLMANLPVLAQQQTAGEVVLEEITVTARKVSESLQKAPVSVTAFTADYLASAGIRDIAQIARQTPGFAMQENSRVNDQPFIRGMSVNSFFRRDQNASSFIDGVFVQGLARTLDLGGEVERVEVLKGPQSALFGRATFSGAINYVLKKPTNEPEGRVSVTVGENGWLDGNINASGPIVADRLQARVNLQGHNYNGQWRNVLDNTRLGTEETLGASTMLRATPTDNFEALARVSYVQFRDGHAPTTVIGGEILNFSAGGVNRVFRGVLPVPAKNSVSLNLARLNGGFRNTSQSRSSLHMNWDFDNVTFSSTTGYNYEKFDYASDGDGKPVSASGGLFESRFSEQFWDFSQDFRLQSAQAERLRWFAGVSYFDGKYAIAQLFPTVTLASPRFERNYSAYGSVSYDVTDIFTASFDGRYQSENIRVRNPASVQTRQQKSKIFLPRAILDMKATEDQLFYISAARGNRPADFNTAVNTPPDLINIKEQTLWSYEVGSKSTFLDNRARLNLSAYWIDWSNQVTRFEARTATGGIVNINTNAGKSRIKGFEAEATAAVTSGLEVRGVFSYTNAKFLKFASANCLLAFGNANCDGNKLQNTPPYKGAIGADYRAPLSGDWNWFLRGDLEWRSSQFVDEINLTKTESFTFVNLRGGIERENLSLTLFINNATQEKAPAFVTRFLDLTRVPNTFGYQTTLRRGREAGVTATYTF
jgi:outer membrane receptor protein involved in Fe transport